jgi:hypothetical protein
MCLQFGFVIFWRKDFGAKAAHKMLVKLTPVLPKPFVFLKHNQNQDKPFYQLANFTEN